MRVISQDGTMDFPYDSSLVSIYEGCINGRIYVRVQLCGGYDDSVDVADYSAKEKAIKAMEMLREAYTGKPKLNVDEIPNLAPQEFGEKLGVGDILLCDKVNADVSFSSNYYFRFPQDDEVEV